MQKFLIIFLVLGLVGTITLIIINGGHLGKSEEDRVKSAVKKFVKENTNDPSSYSPVSFDIARDVNNIRCYHSFRVKNGLGAIMLYNYEFRLDTNYVVTIAKDLNDIDVIENNAARKQAIQDSIAKKRYKN